MISFGPNAPPSDSLGAIIHSLCEAPIAAAFTTHSEEPPPLFANEVEGISRAVPSRRREFTIGRWAARRALAALGAAEVGIPIGPRRAPCWPDGIVGSITHCAGFVGAMVARAEHVRGLGFDAEPATALADDLRVIVCTPTELAWIATARVEGPNWEKVFFCAKEALHKCISPTYSTMLDFLDVSIAVDSSGGVFRAFAEPFCSVNQTDLARVRGRFAVSEELVFACAWIDAG